MIQLALDKIYSLTELNLSEYLRMSITLESPENRDISLFGLDSKQKLKDERYFIFYNQTSSPNDEITLKPGINGETQRFEIKLDRLPLKISNLQLVFSTEDEGSDRGAVFIKFIDEKLQNVASLIIPARQATENKTDFSVLIHKASGMWQISTKATSSHSGLKEVLEHFGGEVANDAADTDLSLPRVENALPPIKHSLKVETRIALPLPQLKAAENEQAPKILELISKIPNILERLQTEEATKHALVMPLLQALGYDVFDPNEVVPEFTADVGIKRGEKVDYAIMQDGKPSILIECKHHTAQPSVEHASQLYRYFGVTDARFAILTNGIIYSFYTDFEKTNTMDKKPFLEINLLKLKEGELVELMRFSKHAFSQDSILGSANEMKYVLAIKQNIESEFSDPSDEFIKMLISKIYDGRLTNNIRNKFAVYTKKALNEFVSQLINERLRTAFDAAAPAPAQLGEAEDQDSDESGLSVSPEEWQGYYIVKSILRDGVTYSRVNLRKHQSYCAVLLDNNRRKTLCRLYFTEKRLMLGLFRGKERQK